MKDHKKNIQELSLTLAKMMTMLPCLCQVEGSCHPRGWMLAAIGKRVVARPGVLLATGEKNNNWQITRSVICFKMREQSLTTVVGDLCRAFEQPSDLSEYARIDSMHQQNYLAYEIS